MSIHAPISQACPSLLVSRIHSMQGTLRCVLLAGAAGACTGLSGCAANFISDTAQAAPQSIQGKVHGGQQPVANAVITLMAPGTLGYGSAGSVITTTTTDANGFFTLTRPYPCPVGNGLTYIVSTGGNPGAGVNPLLVEAAVLGPCSSLSASQFIFIDEVTTVAAAYALAPFATLTGSVTNIGTSASNLIGLANAAGPANNLVDTAAGVTRASLPGMVLPAAEINTLADILAACVNTNAAAGTATPCTSLFTAATPPGGTPPNDTFQAAIDIALNPGNNAATLYGLFTASAPFQPTLAAAPGDFAVAIQYTGGQIAASGFTSGLAIDAQGNAWVGNAVGNNPKSISEISPAGVFLSGTNGFANGIAGGNGFSIDSSGDVFVNVAALNETLELSSAGTIINTFATPSLVKPTGIAVNNRDGSIWSADSNNQPSLNNGNSDFTGTTATHATSTGMDEPGSPYTGLNGPFAVQIDGLGDVWVASTGANTTGNGAGFITKYTPPATAGNPYTAMNVQTGQNSLPFELAFDSTNNVWVAEVNSVGKFSNAGTQLSMPNYTAAPNNFPTSIMIDGLGRAFVSNNTSADFSTPGSLTVFSNNGTLISTSNGSKGYLAGNTIPYEPFAPSGIGIDPSGNVWISGINNSATNTNQFVTEIVGIAAPVVTPTTVASSTNKYGQRP